jgi:hypothetical protein
MAALIVRHFGPLEPNIVSEAIVRLERRLVRTAITKNVRENEFRELYITLGFTVPFVHAQPLWNERSFPSI